MFLLTLAAIFGGMAIYLHGQEKMAPPPRDTSTKLRSFTSTKLNPKTSLKGSARKENDKKQKTRQEKKLLKEAQQLYKKKNPIGAAQILESIGMNQEAIVILQKSQKFEEAGKLASRAGMHKRAGRIFAKIKQWEHAASNFKQAGMFEEAGQCYHQFGDYTLALECFKQTDNYDAVAKCYTILQEYRKAAMTYLRFKKVGKAVPLYQKMYQDNPDRWTKTKFAPEELKAFSTWIKAGNPDLAFAWTLYHAKKLSQLILDLADDGEIRLATKIFVKDPNEFDSPLASKLVAEVRYETEQAANLVQIFQELGHYYHQGIVLEKLERFKEAAEAFRQSGEVSRAVHCYQRAGLHEEASKLESDESNAQKAHSEKIAAQKAKLASGESPDFSLEGISQMSDVKNSAEFEKEENTKLLVEERPGEAFSAASQNQNNKSNFTEQDIQVPQTPSEQVPVESLEGIDSPTPEQAAPADNQGDLFNPANSNYAQETRNTTNNIATNELFGSPPLDSGEKFSPPPSFDSNEQIKPPTPNPPQAGSQEEELSSNNLFTAPSNPSESQETGLTTNDLFGAPQNPGQTQEAVATPKTQFSATSTTGGDGETGLTSNDLFGAPASPPQRQESNPSPSNQFSTQTQQSVSSDANIVPSDMFSAPASSAENQDTNNTPVDMFSAPTPPPVGQDNMFSSPTNPPVGQDTNINPNDMFSAPAGYTDKSSVTPELELDINAQSNQLSPSQPVSNNSDQADLNINLDQPTGGNFNQENSTKGGLSDSNQTNITHSPINDMGIKPPLAADSPAAEFTPNLNQEPKSNDRLAHEEQKIAQEIPNPDPLSDIFSSFGADSSTKDLAKSSISEREKQAFNACLLFNNISINFVDEFWQLGHIEKLKKNDSIMTLQDHPLGVYIILSGTVVCESEGDQAKQRRLVATECFGESSVFASNPTGATFTAVEDSLILKINATKFKNLMQKDYSMAVQLFKNYTDRLLSPTMPSEIVHKNQDNS